MTQRIDVLSASGLRTGEVLSRAEIHRLGKRHRAVHLYLFNANDELLMQRRAATVDHAAGVYTPSALGHVDAGEYSALTVRREVEEELGIPAAALQIDFLFSYYQEAVLDEPYIDRQFNDVYVTRADVAVEQIQFDRSEVSEVKFVPFARFREIVLDGSSELAAVYLDEVRELDYFLNRWHAHEGRSPAQRL